MIDQQNRLRGLVAVGIALSAELSLDAVLERVVEAAAGLTGARFAALGVIDRAGTGLERFLYTGIDDDLAHQIGSLPVGRGILGALIRDAEPLRLRDLGEDPRSVGFPPGHPPMRSFLGVPIMLRSVAYGNLYLTEKEGGAEFTDDDEELVRVLAAQAAVAIENARLYESATSWLRQLESMEEIAQALVSDLDLRRMLGLICSRLRELVSARSVFVALPDNERGLRIEATSDDDASTKAVGLYVDLDRSVSGRAYRRLRTFRVDSFIDDPEIDHGLAREFAQLTGQPVPTAGIFAPLVVRDRAIGVIVVHDKARGTIGDVRFTEEDVRLVETLASRAAVAVDLSQRVQRDALRRVVAAQEAERQRLARELHDETGQALTSMLLGLRAAEDATSAEARNEALASLRALATETLRDVRRIAVELRPKALDDFGLTAALEALVTAFGERTGLNAQFESSLMERLPREVETALYRIVQEGLTNVVKHANARHVSVLLARKGSAVSAVIEDDGAGFAVDSQTEGLGVIGMRERVALLGGSLTIESREGAGSTFVAKVPLP